MTKSIRGGHERKPRLIRMNWKSFWMDLPPPNWRGIWGDLANVCCYQLYEVLKKSLNLQGCLKPSILCRSVLRNILYLHNPIRLGNILYNVCFILIVLSLYCYTVNKFSNLLSITRMLYTECNRVSIWLCCDISEIKLCLYQQIWFFLCLLLCRSVLVTAHSTIWM